MMAINEDYINLEHLHVAQKIRQWTIINCLELILQERTYLTP